MGLWEPRRDDNIAYCYYLIQNAAGMERQSTMARDLLHEVPVTQVYEL